MGRTGLIAICFSLLVGFGSGCGSVGEANGESESPLIAGLEDGFVLDCIDAYNDGTGARAVLVQTESLAPFRTHLSATRDGRCLLIVMSDDERFNAAIEHADPAVPEEKRDRAWTTYPEIMGSPILVPDNPDNPDSVDVVSPPSYVSLAAIPSELQEPNLALVDGVLSLPVAGEAPAANDVGSERSGCSDFEYGGQSVSEIDFEGGDCERAAVIIRRYIDAGSPDADLAEGWKCNNFEASGPLVCESSTEGVILFRAF